jgi:hypothetical protein
MGTGATVELHEPLSLRDAERLAEGVFAWLHAVDHGFSTFPRRQLGPVRDRPRGGDLRNV